MHSDKLLNHCGQLAVRSPPLLEETSPGKMNGFFVLLLLARFSGIASQPTQTSTRSLSSSIHTSVVSCSNTAISSLLVEVKRALPISEFPPSSDLFVVMMRGSRASDLAP